MYIITILLSITTMIIILLPIIIMVNNIYNQIIQLEIQANKLLNK